MLLDLEDGVYLRRDLGKTMRFSYSDLQSSVDTQEECESSMEDCKAMTRDNEEAGRVACALGGGESLSPGL